MMQGTARAAWSLVDQVLVSARNFLLLFIVIRSMSSADVGTFGLVYASFFFLLALVRGLAGDPLVVRSSGLDEAAWRAQLGDSGGAVIVVGSASAVLLCAGGLAYDATLARAIAALGVALVPLLLQDHLRLGLFAQGRPRSASANDAFVLVAQMAGAGALAVQGRIDVVSIILLWGASAVAGVLIGVRQCGTGPRLSAWRRWFADQRDLAPAFAADAVANRGTEQVSNMILSAISGLPALGALTAARTLFAPLTTVQTGVNAFLMPEVARRIRTAQTAGVNAVVASASAAMGAFMVVMGIALWLVPDAVGRWAFSDNWAPAHAVLAPMTVFSCANAISFGYWAGLKAKQRARRTLLIRSCGGIAQIAFVSGGARLGGVSAAIWGMAAAAVLTAGWLSWEFHTVRQEDKKCIS